MVCGVSEVPGCGGLVRLRTEVLGLCRGQDLFRDRPIPFDPKLGEKRAAGRPPREWKGGNLRAGFGEKGALRVCLGEPLNPKP